MEFDIEKKKKIRRAEYKINAGGAKRCSLCRSTTRVRKQKTGEN